MPIRPDLMLAHVFPEARQRYGKRDTILYALGAGLGRDPGAPLDLAFLLEDRLKTLPTFAATLASPGMWIKAPEFGVDFAKLVHYEQAMTVHAPLPSEADVISRARVISVTDRGESRGAIVVLERNIQDAENNLRYCTLRQTLLLRGDGGFGGALAPHMPSIIPEREPDVLASFPIDLRAALIYRLSGDWNPLHADPDAARRSGFDKPILHGLASYAAAAIAVSRACGFSPDEMTALSCRFAGVVYPGDMLEFRIWRDPKHAIFQAFVADRKALDQGMISYGSGH